MKHSIIILLVITLHSSFLPAQTRRALVIGVDTYAPPPNDQITNESGRTEYDDLDGCRNDATTIRAIIQTKYGFNATDTRELYDRDATRKNILNAIMALLNACRPGDIALIYYAGHGSQQKNSRSRELDKMDESIVPADAWKKGIGDIRDKEQAVIYNAFIDKGVKLTVILDCCHSGSMSRGPLFDHPKKRYLPASHADANDPSDPPAPENRKGNDFLLISATQDNESAEEQVDEHNVAHGAFTLAFLHALDEQPVDASVENVFLSTRAILKGYGKSQEPGLTCSDARKQQTLFGIERGVLSDKVLIPFSEMDSAHAVLLGGYALGLNTGNELTMVGGSVVIRIDSLIGINRSKGVVIKGAASDIKPGSLFEITNWVSNDAPLLRIYIPPSAFSYSDLLQLAAIDKTVRSSGQVQWVNDLEKTAPYSSFWYEGNQLYENRNGSIPARVTATSAPDFEKLSAGKSFFLSLPLSAHSLPALMTKFSGNRNLAIVKNAGEADYILYGSIDEEGVPCYGLIRRQLALKDSLGSLPLQTQWFPLPDDSEEAHLALAAGLYGAAAKLAKIRGWLNLSGPHKDYFPFHLAVINALTKIKIGPEGDKIGDKASLHLIADPIPADRVFDIKRKFIYAFVIDHDGKMQLLFPLNGDENQLPIFTADDKFVRDIELLHDYDVTAPAGTDNFFLLASAEPIADADNIFNQDGVRSRDVIPDSTNSMATLLNLGNEGARSIDPTPADWNLLKLSVKTSHR